MRVPQVRFADLLADPTFKAWVLKPREKHPVVERPWRTFVQLEEGGKWAKKDHASYAGAVKFAAKMAKRGAWDLAVHHRPGARPNIRVKRKTRVVDGAQRYRFLDWMDLHPTLVAGHQWCGLCGRPTIFRRFSKHHAFQQHPPNPDVRRCSICGASERCAAPPRSRPPSSSQQRRSRR